MGIFGPREVKNRNLCQWRRVAVLCSHHFFFSFLVYAHEMCWKTRAEGVVHIGRENWFPLNVAVCFSIFLCSENQPTSSDFEPFDLAISSTDSRVNFYRISFDSHPLISIRLSDIQTVLLRTQTESFLYLEGEKSAPLWENCVEFSRSLPVRKCSTRFGVYVYIYTYACVNIPSHTHHHK